MLFAVVASAMMLMIGFAAIVSDDSSADEIGNLPAYMEFGQDLQGG